MMGTGLLGQFAQLLGGGGGGGGSKDTAPAAPAVQPNIQMPAPSTTNAAEMQGPAPKVPTYAGPMDSAPTVMPLVTAQGSAPGTPAAPSAGANLQKRLTSQFGNQSNDYANDAAGMTLRTPGSGALSMVPGGGW